FRLTRVSDGAAVSFTATASVIFGVTAVKLSNFTGPATENGSLADGRYTLTVLANQFAADGLDGNGDGVSRDNYVLPADPTPNPPGPLTGIFRFFGDATGNGAVDAADFLQFRSDYLLTNVPNSSFDFDNNGSVDAADFLQFRNRYLLTYLP